MKRKYAEIMDRVKLTDSMRSEVLKNVLEASQNEAQDKTPREKRGKARRVPHQGARRGVVAAICAGAAAAACLLVVPAIDASWSARRGPDRVTIVSSGTADSAAENPSDGREETAHAFGGAVQGIVSGTAEHKTASPETQDPVRPDSVKPAVAEGGLSGITEVQPATKRPVQITTAQTSGGQSAPQPAPPDMDGGEVITAGGGGITAGGGATTGGTGPNEGPESVDGTAPMPEPTAGSHPASGPAPEGVVPPSDGSDLPTVGSNPPPDDAPHDSIGPDFTENPADFPSPEPPETSPGGEDAGAEPTDTESSRDPSPVSEPYPGPDPDGTAESFSE